MNAGSERSAEESTLGSLDSLEESDSFLRAAAHVTTPATPAIARAGQVVAGRYHLSKRLGRGGHGDVWEALDTLSGEHVAVKLLLPGTGVLAARVCREVAALRLLRLPGIARLIDEGIDEQSPFLVLERVDGAPFPGVPIPCAWAALEGPLVRLLEALARVHAVGIVHRDLKPGNILVDAEGRPTLLDFGLARLDAPASAGITGDGMVLGTPAYLAPEQISGGPITAQTDLYAVGIIAFHALAGRFPHDGADLVELMDARLSERAPPLARLAPDAPGHVTDMVDRLLARDPGERPRSAAEVAQRLRGDGLPLPPALLGVGAPEGQGPDGPPAEPLDEVALRALFHGPDRLLHLQEDGARALWARTRGVPARVAREIDAWTRAALARWDGDRLVVDRDALERLAPEGLPLAADEGFTAAPSRPPLSLAAELTAGAPGRLQLLLAAGEAADPVSIAAEARASASRLAVEGQLARAVSQLAEGAHALRRAAPVPIDALEALLACWVEIALTDGAPKGLDRVLYELCRPGPRGRLLDPLERLVRAALAVNAWTARAAQLADAVPAFPDPRLERLRMGVRVLAARRSSLAREEEVLAEVARACDGAGDAALRASYAAWLGRLRYCQNRFEEAARLADEAAEGAAWLPARIAARLDGASAWMEAFRLEEAAACVAEGTALARRCRHALLEARAEWLSRCIAYRAGRADAGGPDRELVEAASRLGSPHVEGLISVTEAAFAHRAGDLPVVRELGRRARRSFKGTGHPLGGLLAEALLFAAGEALPPEGVAALAARARACPVPSVGLQALALLVEAGAPLELDAEEVAAMAEAVPARHWDARLDVLSVREARLRLGRVACAG